MVAETTPEPGPAWVVGATGLLGRAVVRGLSARGREVLTAQVPWSDHDAALRVLLDHARGLPATGWEVYWCAGAGVVGTSPEQLDAEVALLEAFLLRWEPVGPGAFFLASSAGGVYAGSAHPPFTELSAPSPNSPYGHAKLRSEGLVEAFGERTGVPVLVGRISNLYGPGQDTGKQQGLISLLCRAQVTRQPLSIYVSLDTRRDYLFVDDAAAMILTGLDAVRERGGRHLKVLASERSTTIGAILGDLHRITRRRPPVVLGTSPIARFQVRDLRMRSVAWPPTAGLARTPLMAGMAATMASVGVQIRSGSAGREGRR